MKQFLLLFVSSLLSLITMAQTDTTGLRAPYPGLSAEQGHITASIYPVPVRDNTFTIRCDQDILSLKITNIIGQDIIRVKYTEPLPQVKVILEDPIRGMYLVTLTTTGNKRIVKKIMIEGNR